MGMGHGIGPVDFLPGDSVGDGGPSVGLEVEITIVPFTFESGIGFDLYDADSNEWFERTRIIVTEEFDVDATISVGEVGNVDFLFNTNDARLRELGQYEVISSAFAVADTTIKGYVNAPGATQGAGRIVLVTSKE